MSRDIVVVHGDYTISREGSALSIQSSRYGSWKGNGVASSVSNPKSNEMSLRFEFCGERYFLPSNKGHFAVALQGLFGPGLHGRGVVIGNLAELENRGRCGRTEPGHRVSIEGFYGPTNCVLGNSTSSPVLIDGERYRLELTARSRLISYNLEQRVGARWQLVSQASLYDTDGQENPGGQWWITEVFSQPGWRMKFNTIVETRS